MNRIIQIENIRKKLIKGKVSLGSWIQLANSSIAEIMGKAGYDWIAVDMEHGSIVSINCRICFALLNWAVHCP